MCASRRPTVGSSDWLDAACGKVHLRFFFAAFLRRGELELRAVTHSLTALVTTETMVATAVSIAAAMRPSKETGILRRMWQCYFERLRSLDIFPSRRTVSASSGLSSTRQFF